MPEEMYSKSFEKLFKFLLDKGLVTLGLYRLPGASDNSTHPYVFTNPGRTEVVSSKDRIFVLGKDIPKDFIIDHSKSKDSHNSGSNEQDKGPSKHSNMSDYSKEFYGI